MSHPIMSRLQPQPAAFAAPKQSLQLQTLSAPGALLLSHNIRQFQRLTLVNLENKPYWRVAETSSLPARFFSASADNLGTELQSGDRHHAVTLASHFTGIPQQAISDIRLITSFSDSYPAVNRLLPVWQVEFAGEQHLHAYIDTDQARLTALTNNTSYLLAKLFRLGHNWAFLDELPVMQVTLMTLMLAATLFSACSGLYLYIRRRHRVKQRLADRPLQHWHRRLGLLVALSALLFASSGVFHLIMSFRQVQQAIPSIQPSFYSNQLSAAAWREVTAHPAQKLDLVNYQGSPLWLLHTVPTAQVAMLKQENMHADHRHHEGPGASSRILLLAASDDREEHIDLLELARSQAAIYAKRPLTEIVGAIPVTSFGDEYGFQFKRLPVVKVQFRGVGNPRYYLEPASGALAAKIEDSDALEGWTFAYLHKWNFANFNKDVRDALVMLFALGNVLVALMGTVLFYRRGS